MNDSTTRRIVLLFAAAAAFGLGPQAGRLGLVAGSGLLVALGVILALAASGAPSAITVAAGALGAFASGVLLEASAPMAGAILLTLCYAERSLRVRTTMSRGAHLGLAALAGALAAGLIAHFPDADMTVQGVLVVVSAVLAALPLVIEADDPLAHALEGLADEVAEPAKSSLNEGAELCRHVDSSLLDRQSQKTARQTWRALLGLAQARARLERRPARVKGKQGAAVSNRLDAKIAEHVHALTVMYTAADDARAAEVSLDDRAMRSVEAQGETLEQMSRAIVEEV